MSRAQLRLLLSLRALPWRVVRFYVRARWHAARSGDRFSLASAARPHELAVSYDPTVRPERMAYLKLAGPSARERIELRAEPDTRGPHVGDAPTQLLFIDSEHRREPVLGAFRAWRGALAPGGAGEPLARRR